MGINHRRTSKVYKRTFHGLLEAFCSTKCSFSAKMCFSLMYGSHVLSLSILHNIMEYNRTPQCTLYVLNGKYKKLNVLSLHIYIIAVHLLIASLDEGNKVFGSLLFTVTVDVLGRYTWFQQLLIAVFIEVWYILSGMVTL